MQNFDSVIVTKRYSVTSDKFSLLRVKIVKNNRKGSVEYETETEVRDKILRNGKLKSRPTLMYLYRALKYVT